MNSICVSLLFFALCVMDASQDERAFALANAVVVVVND
jgi:hypothetical protein